MKALRVAVALVFLFVVFSVMNKATQVTATSSFNANGGTLTTTNGLGQTQTCTTTVVGNNIETKCK